jgi:hypothetical protein
MQLIGKIKSTNRTVYYIDSTKKWWWRNLPEKNWVGMIFSGDSKKIKKTIIKYCLNKNISHITVVWRYADGIESDFDSEIVGRKIESWEYPSNDDAFNDSPCTTSNEEFKEGFWYCCYTAFWVWDESIKNVVCVDWTWKIESNVLKKIVKKFNTWYIPGASHELEKYKEKWYPILHHFCEFKKEKCCKELPTKALIPMSVDTGKSMRRVFKHLKYKKKDKWWVGVLQCKKCKQYWLMAQEERIHDNWFIEKMNVGDLEK